MYLMGRGTIRVEVHAFMEVSEQEMSMEAESKMYSIHPIPLSLMKQDWSVFCICISL